MFMNCKIQIVFFIALVFCLVNCKEKTDTKMETSNKQDNFELEKAAILETINGETKAAFNRDYKSWKDKWIHESYVTKTYMQFPDSSMTETLGWEEINGFVRSYIEAHPEPAPLPTMVNDISVRLYGSGAWVSYEQNDAERGLKRETRLMEKVNGQWKIAGMHTTIYGVKKE